MTFIVNVIFKEKHGSSGEHSLKKAGRPRLADSPLRRYWREAKRIPFSVVRNRKIV
jgi:hypothetical protein